MTEGADTLVQKIEKLLKYVPVESLGPDTNFGSIHPLSLFYGGPGAIFEQWRPWQVSHSGRGQKSETML